MRTAFVLTVSDGVAAGTRLDESGDRLSSRLRELGFDVRRGTVPDDAAMISGIVRQYAGDSDLVITTGGTGLGPRDVTPQALRSAIDYEIPGFGEVMREVGRRSTPMADLSRSFAGVMDRCLVVAVPGSPGGAMESVEALVPILDHALETLGGHTQHVHADDEARDEAVGE